MSPNPVNAGHGIDGEKPLHVAPFAEQVARTLWSTIRKPAREHVPATRLTQRLKREAKAAPPLPPRVPAPTRENICHECGAPVARGSTYCHKCSVAIPTEHLVNAAQAGRVLSQSAEAQARRVDTQRRHHAERGTGTRRANRLGSMKRPTGEGFSPGSQALRDG